MRLYQRCQYAVWFSLGFPQGRVPGLRRQNVKEGAGRAGDGGIAGGAGTELTTLRGWRVFCLQKIVHSLGYLFVSFDLAALLKLNIDPDSVRN